MTVNLHKAVRVACINDDTTITALAKTMGVNRKTLYSAIHNGNPTLSTIENIARALSMSASELIAMGEEL